VRKKYNSVHYRKVYITQRTRNGYEVVCR